MKDLSSLPKQKLGYLEAIVSIITNSLLAALKIWVGMLSRSVAMIADAWHTLSDSFTSLVVIIGFWVSGKPADKEHPFGHGRAELIASIIIGTLLAVVGFNFTVESIKKLIAFEKTSYSVQAIIVFAASVIIKELLAQFSFKLGKITGSTSLIADGWHHRSDGIASLLIVIGALLARYLWWIDGFLGIVVSVLILQAAYSIVKENSNNIMGEDLASGIKEEITQLVYTYSDKVSDAHHFHIHKYGDHSELTFHLRFDKATSVENAHDITCQIEKLLKEKYHYEVTIHVEPDTKEG
ncbi:MAG TPA: cation diffusion facilitator family transporter [Termitinemataceae bacterium]|nr:cation diffusion facilitator family transporter [Termitinemataceae bacterium]HOM24291.1 cation diffusion facilitator family transporter [Termitinemataceae bacterium]HPQ01412.1 cation diffusion facilitator family transporter [Termitinemataceae bacterium]